LSLYILLALAAGCAHVSPTAPAASSPVSPAGALVAAAGALDLVALESGAAVQPVCMLATGLATVARAGSAWLVTAAPPAVTLDLSVCGAIPPELSCEATSVLVYLADAVDEVALELDAPDGRVSWGAATPCLPSAADVR